MYVRVLTKGEIEKRDEKGDENRDEKRDNKIIKN